LRGFFLGQAHGFCLLLAFWVAIAQWLREREREASGRFVLGLALGAAFAHLGWALLHARALAAAPQAVLDVSRGFCVLFVPTGLLAVAPWRRGRGARDAFLGPALRSLPLALATARVGCLAAGCCLGTATSVAWGVEVGGARVHATPLYEIAGLLLLHLAARRAPLRLAGPAVLAGVGAVRLAVEPVRARPGLGDPLVPASALALAWIAIGLALALRRAPRGRRSLYCPFSLRSRSDFSSPRWRFTSLNSASGMSSCISCDSVSSTVSDPAASVSTWKRNGRNLPRPTSRMLAGSHWRRFHSWPLR
jgi:hypothetical protein